jgi:hypothetical protein
MRKLILVLIVAGAFLMPFFSLHKVSGRVTAADGLALPGVSILSKGSPLATHTDNNGQFRLSVQPGAVLIVSCSGSYVKGFAARCPEKIGLII